MIYIHLSITRQLVVGSWKFIHSAIHQSVGSKQSTVGNSNQSFIQDSTLRSKEIEVNNI